MVSYKIPSLILTFINKGNKMGKNTIVLHACGGCGIQLSHSVFETIANLGEGFSNIKTLYIDTSTSNYDKIQPKSDLFLIKTKDLGKGEIRGSGSERQTNAKDIIPNVKHNRKYIVIEPRKSISNVLLYN